MSNLKYVGPKSAVIKDFDVLRCVKCEGIIQVPKIALEYECPNCSMLNVYELTEEEEDE